MQTVFLVLIGVSVLAAALSLGAQVPWLRLLDSNAGLLSMLAAVSFLQLITIGRGAVVAKAQRGPGAFGRTLLSVAVFGGFINISAMLLVANRLAQERGLSAFACQSITRAFSGCPTWSPFFAGMAVVLTYVAETNLLFVMLVGLPFSVVGLLLVFIEAIFRYRQDFMGFILQGSKRRPPSFASLQIDYGLQLPGLEEIFRWQG